LLKFNEPESLAISCFLFILAPVLLVNIYTCHKR
jgi:hypothetical protein